MFLMHQFTNGSKHIKNIICGIKIYIYIYIMAASSKTYIELYEDFKSSLDYLDDDMLVKNIPNVHALTFTRKISKDHGMAMNDDEIKYITVGELKAIRRMNSGTTLMYAHRHAYTTAAPTSEKSKFIAEIRRRVRSRHAEASSATGRPGVARPGASAGTDRRRIIRPGASASAGTEDAASAKHTGKMEEISHRIKMSRIAKFKATIKEIEDEIASIKKRETGLLWSTLSETEQARLQTLTKRLKTLTSNLHKLTGEPKKPAGFFGGGHRDIDIATRYYNKYY